MRRRDLILGLGGTALGPLTALPARADTPDACGIPVSLHDDWPIAAVADEKLADRGALCNMADGLVSSGANVHSVLVARGGKLVFERYFKGLDEIRSRRAREVTFDVATLHDMKSVSKSVASLAVGIAIDRGLIRSVDEPIFSFFPELSDLRTAEKDQLRLRHALTMSMGLKWEEATPATGDDNNDEERMHRARDASRYVLGLPQTAPPGKEFFYNTGALALVSAIVRKATGRPLDEFARETLLEPLGIREWEWNRFKGDTDAGGGLRLRPRDMGRIGQFVLAGGRWDGRQIVSSSWIEASASPKIQATERTAYGYLWWLGRAPYKGRDVQWIGALGRGGQYIRIVPELDLVVSVPAGYYQDYSPEAFRLQYGIFKDVLQSI
jgi:CubicO group peptidase (beta-lactamase class C family)